METSAAAGTTFASLRSAPSPEEKATGRPLRRGDHIRLAALGTFSKGEGLETALESQTMLQEASPKGFSSGEAVRRSLTDVVTHYI